MVCYKNSICVIGVYFGKFNNYFPLWLNSCKYNPNIDFLIFNDCDYTFNVPSNVKLIPFTLNDFKKLAIKKTGITNIYLDNPYKCCDFKPLYGEVFQDYILNYEYWGHCDFDLIFGDIYYFLKKYEYEKYDKFLHLGHLSFYKNTREVNHYYTKNGAAHPYTEALTSSKNFSFDEYSNLCQIYLKNNLPLFYKKIFADISPLYERYKLSEKCCVDKKSKNYDYQIFYWEEGKTYRAYVDNKQIYVEEFMYVHFQKRKNFNFSFDLEKTNSFYITPIGFVPKKGPATIDVIRELNPPSLINETIADMKYKFRYYKNALRIKLLS